MKLNIFDIAHIRTKAELGCAITGTILTFKPEVILALCDYIADQEDELRELKEDMRDMREEAA